MSPGIAPIDGSKIPTSPGGDTNTGHRNGLTHRLLRYILRRWELDWRSATHGACASPDCAFTNQCADRPCCRVLPGLTHPSPVRSDHPARHHPRPARHSRPTAVARVPERSARLGGHANMLQSVPGLCAHGDERDQEHIAATHRRTSGNTS